MTASLTGIHVLVVDDHEDTRDVLDQTLRWMGATVSAMASAREALAGAAEAHVILTDVALAGEDGVWLWEQVNHLPWRIPVIAVTGFTAAEYPRMTQARFARTLLKPVDPYKVGEVVWEVLRGAESSDAPPSAGAHRPADLIRVKLADGRLPTSIDAVKFYARYGQGSPCSGCAQTILAAQVEYAFDLGQDAVRFHQGCYGLWEAERRRRGLSR